MKTKLAAIINLLEDSSRLHPLTLHRPVASLPFGCRYRLIDFPFSSLHNAQVISAGLFIPGSGHSLYDHIRSGSVWGLDSLVGGGVFTHSHINWKWERAEQDQVDFTYYDNHRRYVHRSKSDHVLITGSNVLSNVNLDAVIQYHVEKGNRLTAVFKNIPRSALAEETNIPLYEIDGSQEEELENLSSMNRVPMDVEKVAAGMNTIIMEPTFFDEFLQYAEDNMKEVSSSNAILYALEKNESVSAFEYTGYMKVIETIEDYFEANMDMLEERNFASLFYRNDPVVTRTHYGAPTYYGKDSSVTDSQLASDCEIYGQVEHSLVFRKTVVKEGATVTNSIVMQDATIGKDAFLNYVILDKDVQVEDGVRLEGTKEKPIVIKKGSVVTKENQ